MVILEASESDHWFSAAHRTAVDPWRYALTRFVVREEPADEDEQGVMAVCPVVPGGAHWFVESGVQWGGLACSSERELWRWDGKKRIEFDHMYRLETS